MSKNEWRFDVLIRYGFTKIEYGIRRVTDRQTDRRNLHTLTSQDTGGSIGRSARRSTGPYQSLGGAHRLNVGDSCLRPCFCQLILRIKYETRRYSD